jgi:hypothetical protein
VSLLQRSRVAKKQLITRLPEDGEPGLTSYRTAGKAVDVAALIVDRDAADELREISAESPTGSVLFAAGGTVMLVAPPFAVSESVDYSEIYARPLVEMLDKQRSYAVFLLRLGGFSVGFFRGAQLIDSKTDQRFVKNRNRKGGQSQRRFERIREKQVDELFGKACETARERLEPYASEIEHVFLGGDRGTIAAFRKECSYFERYGERLMQRVLHVPGDPRRATLDAMPREVWSSDVWTLEAG